VIILLISLDARLRGHDDGVGFMSLLVDGYALKKCGVVAWVNTQFQVHPPRKLRYQAGKLPAHL